MLLISNHKQNSGSPYQTEPPSAAMDTTTPVNVSPTEQVSADPSKLQHVKEWLEQRFCVYANGPVE